jgi:hypothetical protein
MFIFEIEQYDVRLELRGVLRNREWVMEASCEIKQRGFLK